MYVFCGLGVVSGSFFWPSVVHNGALCTIFNKKHGKPLEGIQKPPSGPLWVPPGAPVEVPGSPLIADVKNINFMLYL